VWKTNIGKIEDNISINMNSIKKLILIENVVFALGCVNENKTISFVLKALIQVRYKFNC
jgi:hypothetical protein